jgi:hypothetical protein
LQTSLTGTLHRSLPEGNLKERDKWVTDVAISQRNTAEISSFRKLEERGQGLW